MDLQGQVREFISYGIWVFLLSLSHLIISFNVALLNGIGKTSLVKR